MHVSYEPVFVTACTLARQMMWAKMPRSAARHLCKAATAARLAPCMHVCMLHVCMLHAYVYG
jgi:hypothetical protein